LPAFGVFGFYAPHVELKFSFRCPSFLEGRMRAELLGKLTACFKSVVVDLFLNAARELLRLFAIEGEAQTEEDVLKTHDAETDRTPTGVRVSRLLNRVEVDVDHAIEEFHRCFDGASQLFEIELALGNVARKV